MPLSEEELRLLEQMERELAAEDPKFVAALRGRTLQRSARMRTILASGVFLVGIAMMMGGVMSELIWLGIVGFLVMLGSATLALASWRGQQAPPEPSREAVADFGDDRRFHVVQGGRTSRPKKARKPRNQGTFLQRMEQRWQQRRDQGGF